MLSTINHLFSKPARGRGCRGPWESASCNYRLKTSKVHFVESKVALLEFFVRGVNASSPQQPALNIKFYTVATSRYLSIDSIHHNDYPSIPSNNLNTVLRLSNAAAPRNIILHLRIVFDFTQRVAVAPLELAGRYYIIISRTMLSISIKRYLNHCIVSAAFVILLSTPSGRINSTR